MIAIVLGLLLAAPPPSELFRELKWRDIGPYRGGRTKAAAGVSSRPGLFYVGAVNGGVWRTDDHGRSWAPIFDDQPTGSIGAIAVAPSSPLVLYVGSGEGLQRPDLSTGDGIYRSADGGRTGRFRHRWRGPAAASLRRCRHRGRGDWRGPPRWRRCFRSAGRRRSAPSCGRGRPSARRRR